MAGESTQAELARLFDIAAKDFKAIASKLRELDGESPVVEEEEASDAEETVTVVKKKRRQRKKKSTYWTHFELNEFERALKEQVQAGKKADSIAVDAIHLIIPTRSVKELEKQLEMYVKATGKSDFSDLPFMAGEGRAAAPVKKKRKAEGAAPEDTPNTKKKKKKLLKRLDGDPPSKTKSKKDKK